MQNTFYKGALRALYKGSLKALCKGALKALRNAVLTTVAASTLFTTVAQAHHSFSMFNRDMQRVVTGTVARWDFNNPHSWLHVNVKNDDGSEALWSFEGAAPPQLVGRGTTGATFEPGDPITMMFCPLADGRNGGALGWVKVSEESWLIPSDGGCRTDEATVTRWKDWLQKGFKTNKEAEGA